MTAYIVLNYNLTLRVTLVNKRWATNKIISLMEGLISISFNKSQVLLMIAKLITLAHERNSTSQL